MNDFNKEFEEEFNKALDNVNDALLIFQNYTAALRGKVWTSEDMDRWAVFEKKLNEANEKFKDAVEKYSGERPETTGFEV